jgi:hypothetical protein
MPCISCHVGGSSRLSAVGRDFQLRGHRFKGETAPGDWTRALRDYASLAAKLRYSDRQSAPAAYKFQTASLFAGGPLSPKTSFFTEAVGYDVLPNGTEARNTLQDAYAQYVDTPDADRFWWARAGNLYPYAAYSLDGGGRLPLSRPRLLSDRSGGLAPALQRRGVGFSGGWSGGRTRLEAGVTRAEGAETLERTEQFLSLESDWDAHGSGIGLLTRGGWNDTAAAGGARVGSAHRFTQGGLVGRWHGPKHLMQGAFLSTLARDGAGVRRSSGDYLLEAGVNLLTETTGFVRYDDVTGAVAAAGPRTRTIAFGVTQRVPNSGRVVFEFADYRAMGRRTRSLQVDLLLMY